MNLSGSILACLVDFFYHTTSWHILLPSEPSANTSVLPLNAQTKMASSSSSAADEVDENQTGLFADAPPIATHHDISQNDYFDGQSDTVNSGPQPRYSYSRNVQARKRSVEDGVTLSSDEDSNEPPSNPAEKKKPQKMPQPPNEKQPKQKQPKEKTEKCQGKSCPGLPPT